MRAPKIQSSPDGYAVDFIDVGAEKGASGDDDYEEPVRSSVQKVTAAAIVPPQAPSNPSQSVSSVSHNVKAKRKKKGGAVNGIDVTKVELVAVAAAVPPKPSFALLVAQYNELVGKRSCSCHLLKPLLVASLRLIAKQCGFATKEEVSDFSGRRREIPKILLLLAMCVSCETVKDVDLVGGKDFEGVSGLCWAPQILMTELTILHAFHLSFLSASESVPASHVHDIVVFQFGRFRAHLLQHAETNSIRYLVQGKVNKANEHGHTVTQDRLLREGTFALAMHSCITNHYNGVHSDLYCGNLRKQRACVPFEIWNNCPTAVRELVQSRINLLVSFVSSRAAQGQTRVIRLDEIYPDQENLRNHFQIH